MNKINNETKEGILSLVIVGLIIFGIVASFVIADISPTTLTIKEQKPYTDVLLIISILLGLGLSKVGIELSKLREN